MQVENNQHTTVCANTQLQREPLAVGEQIQISNLATSDGLVQPREDLPTPAPSPTDGNQSVKVREPFSPHGVRQNEVELKQVVAMPASDRLLGYRPYCERNQDLPLSRFNLRYRNLVDLMAQWGLTIPAKSFYSGVSKWRTVFPNVGELDGFPHFGKVTILATNGILAYYENGNPNELFLGHLKAFNGPVAKEFVHPNDWDEKERKRRVTIRKKFEGGKLKHVIIPHDTPKAEYWEKHSRLSKQEFQLLANLLRFNEKGELCRGILAFSEYDSALSALNERAAGSVRAKAPKEKTKAQQILDLL